MCSQASVPINPFGKDGPTIAILLGGGTKKRQQRDIEDAQACWQDYKRRKKGKA